MTAGAIQGKKLKTVTALCLVCQINPQDVSPTLGVLPCKQCRQRQNFQIKKPVEWIPDSVKQSRKEFKDDILQSGRDGVLSKEYIDKYGYDHLNITEEQVKGARNVWDDLESNYYKSDNDGKIL